MLHSVGQLLHESKRCVCLKQQRHHRLVHSHHSPRQRRPAVLVFEFTSTFPALSSFADCETLTDRSITISTRGPSKDESTFLHHDVIRLRRACVVALIAA